jgi:hypothetical protein
MHYFKQQLRLLEKNPQDAPKIIESIPASLQVGTLNISKKKCLNAYGVCSTATGFMNGEVLSISRSVVAP